MMPKVPSQVGQELAKGSSELPPTYDCYYAKRFDSCKRFDAVVSHRNMTRAVDNSLTRLLSDLVSIPSVNPMGGALGPGMLEREMTDYLEAWFSRAGIATVRQTIEPGRDNLMACLEGSPDAPVVVFDAHQDTVPVGGMTIEPFTPQVREGRLYGRGACDIKGGMAAMLGAIARLAAESSSRRPTVFMSCTVNEEHGFSGARGLCSLWSEGGSLGQLGLSNVPGPPDMAIVAEPTQLDVVVAHKGMVRWKCKTIGRAAHSSVPHLGDNAIFRMAPVIAALDNYHRNVLAQAAGHPLCGRPTLSVGTIRGGLSVNTVPDSCTIEIDRRLLPDDDPSEAYQEVIDFIAGQVGPDHPVENLPPMMESRGLSDQANHDLAARLTAVAREVHGASRSIGVPFGTNATAFGRCFPTVVFGPGSIEQAHTADEWLALDQLEQASEILYRFVRDFERRNPNAERMLNDE
jgi:acetylornithine deacetylase